MGAADIDRLEIGVEAQATKANRALDALVGKLEKLSASVGKVSGSDFTGFANGIEKICKASAGMSNIKSTDFTRLSKNIEKITSINAGSMNATSSALGMMAKQLSSFGAASANAAGIGEIAKNISKLGNKGVVSAIDNMPKFATALSQMMTTLSKAPQMSKNLVDMTNALANLAASVKGTQAATSKTGNNVSNLSKLFNTLTSSTNRSSRSFKSFSQIAGSFYANFFMITRGMQKAWKSVMSSMDYVETFNYWNVALDKIGTEFGKNFEQYGYDSAEAYANSFSNRIKSLALKMTGYEIGDVGDLSLTGNKNLGLDPEQLMNYQAKIISVTNAVGLCGEISANTAKALSMLSADMSSYTNEDLSSVMTNFQSGLIGQSRALYKFGIDITNATLQQYAYNLGVTKSLSAMTQAEKMQLRLIAILDQSKVAWGDQANTLGSVANQYRIMKQQISNLARTIGNLLLPIIKSVLPVINAMVMSLNRLFTVLGFRLWGDNWLKELQDGTSKGYGSGVEDLGDDAKDAAGGLNDAAKAAKKLKDITLDIDELNINNPNTDSGSSSGSGAGGSIDLSGAIDDALKDYESVWDKAFAESENRAQQIADRICDAFKRGDYEGIGTYISNGISSTLEKIPWESVYGVADNFGTGLAQFLNGLINPRLFGNVGKTIAGSLNSGLHFLNSFGTTFKWDDFGESLTTGVKDFFETWDAELTGETLSTFANGILESATSAIETLKDDDSFKTMGQKLVDFVCGIDWKSLSWNLVDFFAALTDAIATFPVDFAGGIGQSILDHIFGENAPEFKVPDGVEKYVKNSFVSQIPALKIISNVDGTIEYIKKMSECWDILSKNAGDALDNVKIKLSEFKTSAENFASDTKNKIEESLNSIPVWFDENVSPYFSQEKWNELGDNIKNGISEKWNEFNEWWVTTGFAKWWNEDVTPWFTREKWDDLGNNIKTGLNTKWNEFSAWWKNTGFAKWWKDVSSYFTIEKWTWSGIKDGLVQAWNNAIEAIKQIWNKFANWLNEKLTFTWDAVNIAGQELLPAGSITLGKIPTFAEGGFPETGQLFMARENGINEMVGQIGNRNAVANNDQIVQAVSIGVSKGVADAVGQILAPYLSQIAQNTRETADKDMSVSIGDRDIARANERGRRSMGLQLRVQ